MSGILSLFTSNTSADSKLSDEICFLVNFKEPAPFFETLLSCWQKPMLILNKKNTPMMKDLIINNFEIEILATHEPAGFNVF